MHLPDVAALCTASGFVVDETAR